MYHCHATPTEIGDRKAHAPRIYYSKSGIIGSPVRVLIEVQDECGGFPGGIMTDMFQPFEQRSADRTGLGLGLAFSRWGVEANDGRIYARNIPERGCVFTLDLPRVGVPASVVV